MPAFKFRCPQCQQELQVTANGQAEVVQMSCPHCGRTSKVRVRPPTSSPVQPSRSNESEAPFSGSGAGDFQSSQMPGFGSGATNPYASKGKQGYSSAYKRKAKSNSLPTMLIAGVAIAALAMVGGAAFWWLSRGGGGGALGTEASGTYAEAAAKVAPLPSLSNLPRPERLESLHRSLRELTDETNQSVAKLSEEELQTLGAERLKQLEPSFGDYFFRAAQATPKSYPMTEAGIREWDVDNGAAQGIPDLKNYLWTLNSPEDRTNRWDSARFALSLIKGRVETMLYTRAQFPDPLKDKSSGFDWSPESRRILSAFWLQAELERDLATELVAALRDGANAKEFQDRCFATIERYYKPAQELAAIKSEQGPVLIKAPRGTAYERHARITRDALRDLSKELPHELITWTIDQTRNFSDLIEDLQFGNVAGVTDFTSIPMREHFEKMRALAEEERKKKLAEEEEARKELARKEAEQKAKALAEQERQRQVAEAAKNKEASEQTNNADGAGGNSTNGHNPVAGGPGRGFGPPRFGGPPAGFGAGSGGTGPGTAPVGAPPGFGQAPPFGPQGGNAGIPPGPPPAAGPSVTIFISGKDNLEIKTYLEKLMKRVKAAYYETSQSGGEATIKIGFAGELKSVIEAIDFGKVESSDPAKREIRVTIN